MEWWVWVDEVYAQYKAQNKSTFFFWCGRAMGLRIEIQGVPDSLNKYAGRLNCWEYRTHKQEWKVRVMAAVGSRKPPAPLSGVVVHIHYIFPTKARHDPDNYAGKVLLDGLVDAGVITDDSFNCIKLELSAEYQKGVKMTIIEVVE